MKTVSFKVTKTDAEIITKIAKRACDEADKIGSNYQFMDADMDITACHANGNKLDLPRLLEAERFDFCHDVFGIRGHIDRTTGKLKNCFSPRCSQ